MSNSKKSNNSKKENFFKKYGTFLVIAALLIIFVIVAVATKDTDTGSKNEETVFVSMGVSEWQEAVKGEDVMVTTLAQTTCSWCNQFKPVIQKVAEDNNVEVVWIDVDTIASEEEKNSLFGTFEQLQSFGTPYTIITQNGEIKGEISGYVDEAELINTFKEYGVIK